MESLILKGLSLNLVGLTLNKDKYILVTMIERGVSIIKMCQIFKITPRGLVAHWNSQNIAHGLIPLRES